ncbi:MAG: hypothetical protein ACP5OP_00105 [Leptospirillia bacterium]
MNGGRPVNILAGARWQKVLERLPLPEGGRFYAVGGWSRDRILASLERRAPFGEEREIDLVADRGFFPWAEAVFRAFSGSIVGAPHVEPDFLTARLDIREEGELLRIDLAGFRSESYPRPGVLPRTRPGSFLEDSRRRDFPMNALYLEWNPTQKGFRRLFDPFGGERDLSLRTVSLIRPEAFLEDPTRIFRWARLASRLRLSSSVDLLLSLKNALEDPALWLEVGGARVAAEMERLQREEDPMGALALLFSSDVFASLTGGALSHLSLRRKRRLKRWIFLRDSLERGRETDPYLTGASREMFYLALLSALRRRAFERAALALGVGARLSEGLRETLFRPSSWPGGHSYAGLIKESGGDRGHLWGLADRMDRGKILDSLLRCREEELPLWREYLFDGRRLPPLISGQVLRDYPLILPEKRGAILAEIRYCQRTGELKTKDEVLHWLEKRFPSRVRPDGSGRAGEASEELP